MTMPCALDVPSCNVLECRGIIRLHTVDGCRDAGRKQFKRKLTKDRHQHVTCSGGHGRLNRGAWCLWKVQDVGLEAAVDGIQGVVDSDVHHGIHPRLMSFQDYTQCWWAFRRSHSNP